MISLFPNSTVLLYSLRIFGHFPFTWKLHNENKRVSPNLIFNSRNNAKKISNEDNSVFVPSKPWKMWSVVFCLINTLLTIYCAVEENYLVEGRIFGINTNRTPYTIYDCLLFISLFLMNFLSLKNSHKLCKIFNKLHAFLTATKIDIKKYWFIDFWWMAPYLVLIVVSVLLLTIWVVQISLFKNIYHISFYTFITAKTALLISIYSSIFYGILSTVGSLYEVVFSDFTIYSKYIEEQYCNPPLEICCTGKETKTFTNRFVNISSNWEKRENSLDFDKTDNISRKKITLDSIWRCKISLLQLFSYKRLIIDYFDVLIIIFLVELISSTIIPLYFISVLSRSFKEVLMPVCHSISSLVSLLCLLNAPYKMNQAVSLFNNK